MAQGIEMKNNRLMANTFTSILLQICIVLNGFILPRIIMMAYGSEVNGLINSINQFLHIITFIEFGIGAVVQSALYKPLTQNNIAQINCIMTSAQKFFNKTGGIIGIYVVILIFLYPQVTDNSFGNMYSSSLVLVMSISLFAQYYFGIVDQMLLIADQKGYIYYSVQIASVMLNIAASTALIMGGASIQVVKLVTSSIFLLRPIIVRIYVRRHYSIDRHALYTVEPIPQKWNGIAQHISSVIIDNTDTIVLTLFATLKAVSIYSVYHLVVYGIKSIFPPMTSGVQALLGRLWAINSGDIKPTFEYFEWILNNLVIITFGCTGFLILPFVSVYTLGIDDANYYQPIFSVIIVVAHAIHCLRLPYHVMIKAAGKYKETQSCYIMASIINLVVSIVAVNSWGLIGVAIGTLIAMLYQTIWMSIYTSRDLIKRPLVKLLKQISIDMCITIIAIAFSCKVEMTEISYISWLFMAFKIFAIWVAVAIMVNSLFYRVYIKRLLNKMLRHS